MVLHHFYSYFRKKPNKITMCWFYSMGYLFSFPLNNHIPFHQNKMMNIHSHYVEHYFAIKHRLCWRKLLIHIILWHTWIPHTQSSLTRKKLFADLLRKIVERKRRDKLCQTLIMIIILFVWMEKMLYQLKQHNNWCV